MFVLYLGLGTSVATPFGLNVSKLDPVTLFGPKSSICTKWISFRPELTPHAPNGSNWFRFVL